MGCRGVLGAALVVAWASTTGSLGAAPAGRDDVRLAVLLLIRDEAELVRSHLPLWLDLDLAYCVVAAIDDRTVDASAQAFLEATEGAASLVAAPRRGKLRPPALRRFAFHYEFDGLGAARTLVLREAAHRFPEATHALFVDPDWVPLRAGREALLAAARTGRSVFAFRVTDRNGRTERLLDWCFRLHPEAAFKYRWHEALVLPDYDATLLDWEVDEVSGADALSWHRAAHGDSGTGPGRRFDFFQRSGGPEKGRIHASRRREDRSSDDE